MRKIMRERNSFWKHYEGRDFGPLTVLSRGIRWLEAHHSNRLPDLGSCSSIIVASDYSGDRGAEFQVLSFLLVDEGSLPYWNQKRQEIRQKYLQGRGEIAFKRLNDTRRREALLPFLEVANALSGLLVTIAIHKRVRSLFALQQLEPSDHDLPQFAHWDRKVFEKMLRVSTFIAFFIGGLGSSGQNIRWITDEDDIVANPRFQAEARTLCDYAFQFYSQHPIGSFDCVTTAVDEAMVLKDFTAIPDLVAGATSEIVSGMHLQGVVPSDDEAVPLPDLTTNKSLAIVEWYSDYSQPLKRLLCFMPPRRKPWSIKIIDFEKLE
jgi:hypothetical protein